MYLPLTIFLLLWIKDYRASSKKDNNSDLEMASSKIGMLEKTEQTPQKSIPIIYFLVCALVDVHATLFILSAYHFTTITSVMLLEDITIPAAVILSVAFLRIKY